MSNKDNKTKAKNVFEDVEKRFKMLNSPIRHLLRRGDDVTFGPFNWKWYGLLAIIVLFAIYTEQVPVSMIGVFAVSMGLGWFGFTVGAIIPGLNKIGGPTIMALLIPATLVYFDLLPQNTLDVFDFMVNGMDFTNFYVFTLISGSLLTINRKVLFKGFTSVIPSMLIGLVSVLIIGSIIGVLLGYPIEEALFLIVGPSMSGGLAVGSIPLADGYAQIAQSSASTFLTYLIPTQIISSFFAVIIAAVLDQYGKNHPEYSGDGELIKADDLDDTQTESVDLEDPKYPLVTSISRGIFFVSALGLICSMLENWLGLPAAIFAIIICILLNVLRVLPDEISMGTKIFSNVFSSILNPAIMASIGISFLNLEQMLNIISWRYLLLVFIVALLFAIIGFLLAKPFKMHPIESAIVSLNQVSMGGSGNIAILSSSGREELMPFTQIMTRFSGAITLVVLIALFSFAN